jgi:hypothetical protein
MGRHATPTRKQCASGTSGATPSAQTTRVGDTGGRCSFLKYKPDILGLRSRVSSLDCARDDPELVEGSVLDPTFTTNCSMVGKLTSPFEHCMHVVH